MKEERSDEKGWQWYVRVSL